MPQGSGSPGHANAAQRHSSARAKHRRTATRLKVVKRCGPGPLTEGRHYAIIGWREGAPTVTGDEGQPWTLFGSEWSPA